MFWAARNCKDSRLCHECEQSHGIELDIERKSQAVLTKRERIRRKLKGHMTIISNSDLSELHNS